MSFILFIYSSDIAVPNFIFIKHLNYLVMK